MSAGVGIEPDLVQIQTPGIGQHLRHWLTPVSFAALTNTQRPRVFLTMAKQPERSTSSSKRTNYQSPFGTGPGLRTRTWLSKENCIPLLSVLLSIPVRILSWCVVWAGPTIHIRPNRRYPDPWQHCNHRLSNVGSEFTVRRKPDGLE